MHTIAAEIFPTNDANNARVEYTKPKANRIEPVNLSTPLVILWGKADKVEMLHEAVPKEAFLGESEPLPS